MLTLIGFVVGALLLALDARISRGIGGVARDVSVEPTAAPSFASSDAAPQ